MKKMTKTGKTLLLSCLALSAFGSIVSGSTYALFTSEAKTDEGETEIEESDLTSYLNTASNVTINGKTY